MTTRVHRTIHLHALAGAELRTATLEDREHLVVPVIALIGNAVVRPLNSTGPEFVPAEELSRLPAAWNGRPVVPDHPENGTASANEPATLERMRFGAVFNTRYEAGRLKTEAWLDTAKASALGGDPARVVERCRAGETVEVSVGAWVTLEEEAGVSPNGAPYAFRWSEIIPDHLAMLPEGAEGACSVEMGCGAPRAAQKDPTAAGAPPSAGAPEAPSPNDARGGNSPKGGPMRQNFVTKLRELLGFRAGAEDMGVSNSELEERLWDALYAIVPAFGWIEDVHQESSTVVYCTYMEDQLLYFRRTYTVAEDGSVTLGEDEERVTMQKAWVPAMMTAEPETTAAGDCGCKGRRELRAAEHDEPAATAKGEPMSKQDLVGRLIDCERSPFTDKDRKALEAFPEERLKALADGFAAEPEPEEEEVAATPAAPPEPAATPVTAVPDAIVEEIAKLRADNERYRPAALAWETEQKAKKDALIAKLTGAQSAYTEAELQAEPVEKLAKLAAALKLDEPKPDFSGAAFPLRAAESEIKCLTPPDPWGLHKASETKEAN